MKNSNDTIGNRSRNLPVCSAVPQPLRHRVPHYSSHHCNIFLPPSLKLHTYDHAIQTLPSLATQGPYY
jgi:hypothetical protein